MINIVNLSKIYSKGEEPVAALRNVNLNIQQGTIHGIIGLSGAGKSSLIRCLNRIEEPTEGEIWVRGVNLVGLNHGQLRNMRKKMGMIFQGFNLLNSKTVFDNIAFPLRLSKTSEAVISKKIHSLLELVGLMDKSNVYPSTLSGGQKQRVAIARSLANDPDVLLCDEATSALDPKTTKQILSLLKSINKNLGLTMVIVTHEMEVIKGICDYVTILEDGEVIEEGDTLDIFSTPRSNTTKEFVEQNKKFPQDFSKGKCLYLSFTRGSASKPIISGLIKEFNLDVNILCGNIEYIQDKPIGNLVIQIDSTSQQLSTIISYLENNDVKVEVKENEGFDSSTNSILI